MIVHHLGGSKAIRVSISSTMKPAWFGAMAPCAVVIGDAGCSKGEARVDGKVLGDLISNIDMNTNECQL